MTIAIDNLVNRMGSVKSGFPGKELEEALGAKDELIPALLEVMHKTLADARRGHFQEDSQAAFALFVLAKFRVREALPILTGMLSLPGEEPFQIFGDVIFEDMGKIVASLVDADPAPLKEIVENDSLEYHFRTAALEGLIFSYMLDRLPRQDLIEYYRYLLTEKKFSRKPLFLSKVISAACQIYPDELLVPITEAFQSKRVDESLIQMESINFYLKKNKEVVLKYLKMKKSRLVDNLEEEMAWIYRPPTNPRAIPTNGVGHTKTPGYRPSAGDVTYSKGKGRQSSPAVTSPAENVGRNDPCPCGSGKKYKKCCYT